MSARCVVVVGGGVAGLATAWLLRERGSDVVVLEAAANAGGHTQSERVDGFVCERGANGFLDNAPRTLELVQRLGLGDRLIASEPSAARRFVWRGGRMREVPTKPLAFLRSDVVPWATKLRMACEPLVPPKRDDADETVHDFARRRLGEGFARCLLDPMVSGIFAGDPQALSLGAAFPKMAMLEREHGGLFRAMAARKRGPQGGALMSFRDGMGELTGALAASLGASVRTGAAVRGIARRDGRFDVQLDGEQLAADAVVLAVPAHAAHGMVAPLDAGAADALAAIPFAPVSVACAVYREAAIARPLDGFGVLVPRGEGIRALGSLCSDRIFAGHGAPGARMLRTLVGGVHDPEARGLAGVALQRAVAPDLARLFGVRGRPLVYQSYAHERAIAQYTVGHRERVARLDALEQALPGLFFTGASYRGVAVNACIEDAFRVADRAA